MPASWIIKRVKLGPITFNVYEKEPSSLAPSAPILFLVHGAGYTGLTWSFMVRELCGLDEDIRIVAFDLPCHDYLCNTVGSLAQHYVSEYPKAFFFLVGHSLGGSVVTRLAKMIPSGVLGVAIIDIVEETALAALGTMPEVLKSLPKHFHDQEELVAWGLQSKTVKSAEVARVSLASQYHTDPNGTGLSLIARLEDSQAHWRGWFLGLSEAFLAIPAGKLLVLAQTDYLDRPLLIGQMQGRFQLEIVRNTGHAIQEDQPKHLATILHTFVRRSQQAQELNMSMKS